MSLLLSNLAYRQRYGHFYGRCPEGIGRHNVKMSVLLVTFSRPLNGQKRECYIVEEVIKVDELDKGNISAYVM